MNSKDSLGYLIKLLEIDRKSELRKYSRKIIIKKSDFANLILSSFLIGYTHQIKYKDFIPQHLNPSLEERKALIENSPGPVTGKAKKFVSKVSQLFKDRRYLVGHIFYNKNKWHLFYFDQRDSEKRKNHWIEGPHIHFVNYLWGVNVDQLWSSFNTRRGGFSKGLHIKYEMEG